MNGLPNYWGDLNQRPEDAAQGPLPLIDPNMQMTVWIPVYSPHASVAPVLFQRAHTAPTPYSADPTINPYDLSTDTTGPAWSSPSPAIQRSLSDTTWNYGADVHAQAPKQSSPDRDAEEPKKVLRKERRRSQNRKAQRAFRERKESRLRELEEELASVNAKYDALANDHRQITNQLLTLMAERDELLGTFSPPADTCTSVSPRASRRTSVILERGGDGLVESVERTEGREGEDLSPRILSWPTKAPLDEES